MSDRKRYVLNHGVVVDFHVEADEERPELLHPDMVTVCVERDEQDCMRAQSPDSAGYDGLELLGSVMTKAVDWFGYLSYASAGDNLGSMLKSPDLPWLLKYLACDNPETMTMPEEGSGGQHMTIDHSLSDIDNDDESLVANLLRQSAVARSSWRILNLHQRKTNHVTFQGLSIYPHPRGSAEGRAFMNPVWVNNARSRYYTDVAKLVDPIIQNDLCLERLIRLIEDAPEREYLPENGVAHPLFTSHPQGVINTAVGLLFMIFTRFREAANWAQQELEDWRASQMVNGRLPEVLDVDRIRHCGWALCQRTCRCASSRPGFKFKGHEEFMCKIFRLSTNQSGVDDDHTQPQDVEMDGDDTETESVDWADEVCWDSHDHIVWGVAKEMFETLPHSKIKALAYGFDFSVGTIPSCRTLAGALIIAMEAAGSIHGIFSEPCAYAALQEFRATAAAIPDPAPRLDIHVEYLFDTLQEMGLTGLSDKEM